MLTLLFSVVGSLQAEKLVALQALADRNYVARRSTVTPLRAETYVFFKGKHTDGVDGGLKKVPFDTLASTLAMDLQRQYYLPAESVASADLVIAVHWGMTRAEEQKAALMQYDPDALRQAAEAVADARDREAADVSGASRALGASAAAEAKFRSEALMAGGLYAEADPSSSDADILGFKSAASREDEMGETLRAMLSEDRYFVVLVAYDAAALRTGTKRQVWTLRMSLRSAGVNFPVALDRMSNVAGNFFGTRQNDVVLMDSRGRVKESPPGKVIVLGENVPATRAESK